MFDRTQLIDTGIIVHTFALQQLDLRLFFVAALLQYVHDLQHLLLSDKLLMSLQTLIRV